MDSSRPASTVARDGTESPGGADVPTDGFQWPDELPGAPPTAPRPRLDRLTLLRWSVAGLGAALAVIYLQLPLPDGLSESGRAACVVFLVCTTLWMTDVIPMGITGILAVALLALTGAQAPAEAYAAFGNASVFFILGVFILAAAVIHSGLSKRVTLSFLRLCQESPRRMAAGLMGAGTFLTIWMPAQATAAMLYPIALELGSAMRLRRGQSTYGKVLFLSLAWGTMVGSNASFLGSTRAPLALGILERSFGQTITFGAWFVAAAPVVALGLVVGMVILHTMFEREHVDMHAAHRMMDASLAELGPIGATQIKVGAVLAITVTCWITLAGRVDLAAIALVGAVAMFVLRAVRWQDLDGYVNWSIILMYGGAIALGEAVEATGAATWLVGGLLDGITIHPAVAVAVLALLTVLLTEFMSNAAAVAVILPLGFSLAPELGLSPTAIVLTCSLAAGLDFTFPFSSAPNSIVYASGYLSMRDMITAGSVMTVAQVILLLIVSWLFWPLIGVL